MNIVVLDKALIEGKDSVWCRMVVGGCVMGGYNGCIDQASIF